MRLDDSSNEMTETCSAPRHRQRKIHEEEIDPDWKLFNQSMTHNAIDASISIFAYQEREEVVHLIAISRQQHLTQNLAKDLMDRTLHTTGVRNPMYQMLDFRETTLADCYRHCSKRKEMISFASDSASTTTSDLVQSKIT